MELIQSPNRWSCFPTSFAMALGISLKDIINIIGHDGSEILWPELPEPLKRRTFHLQECVAAAFSIGIAVTDHQFLPVATPDMKVFNRLPYRADIEIIMTKYSGVLYGQGIEHGHVVAWDHQTQMIYDPMGSVYRFQNQSIFKPRNFCSFTNIKSE